MNSLIKLQKQLIKKLDLDGIVVIGRDDSNTNACLLAENFRGKGLKTRVIGCPKTIDGDLKCKEVRTSFGFDCLQDICRNDCGQLGIVMTYYHCKYINCGQLEILLYTCVAVRHPKFHLMIHLV